MVAKYYVGFRKDKKAQLFMSDKTPTQCSHGDKYYGVVGPFRTKAGAQLMVDGGHANPHTQSVAQCEKIAAKAKEVGKYGGSVLNHITTKTKRVKDQVVNVTKGLGNAGVDMWNTLKEEPADLGYYCKKKGRK